MLLSFDIAQITGWARRSEGVITFGTRDFSEYSYDIAIQGRMMRGWFAEIMNEYEPSEITIEQPYFDARHPLVAARLYCLVHECHRAAELRNIPRSEYVPGEIKRHVTGDYRAKKDAVMKAVRELGHDIQDEHQADSVALLLLREKTLEEMTNGKP